MHNLGTLMLHLRRLQTVHHTHLFLVVQWVHLNIPARAISNNLPMVAHGRNHQIPGILQTMAFRTLMEHGVAVILDAHHMWSSPEPVTSANTLTVTINICFVVTMVAHRRRKGDFRARKIAHDMKRSTTLKSCANGRAVIVSSAEWIT